MSKTVILKVGGSILSKSEEKFFDFKVAKELKNTLLPLTEEGFKFIMCTGGGYICRKYQEYVRNNQGSKHEENLIGTEICNVNAVMLRIAFGELAHDKPIIGDRVLETTPLEVVEPFLTVGAAEPEHSSDMDAVITAIRAKSKLIISLKNVDAIYSNDPKENPEAIKYDKLTYKEYFDVIGNPTEFIPGGHYPIDPVASKKASENGIKFIILYGENFPNLAKAIKGEGFVGTTVE